jgi:hypothetical protein
VQPVSSRSHHILAWTIAIPVIYFGMQAAAAPFYPGYSFFARDASSLGSNVSTAPWIFNVGSLVVGSIELVVAAAFFLALSRAGVGRVLAVLTALALTSAGLGSLNAFLHPLPDPRHTDGLLAALGSGLALLPVLTTVVFWRLGAPRAAIVNVAAYLAVIPMVTGLVQRVCMWRRLACDGYQYFLNNGQGFIQRVAAAVVLVPVVVIAYRLRRTAASSGDRRGPRADRHV